MKRIVRSISIALLCIATSAPLFGTSFAMENLDEKTKMEETLRAEGFEQIDLSEIPEDVIPIVVNSEEELLEQLEIFEDEISNLEKPVTIDVEQYDEISPLARASYSYKKFHATKKSGTATHNVFGTLKISKGNIISVHNLVQDWTGWHIGTNYSNHPSEKITYSIINNKKTAKIRAPYKVTYYLILEGIGNMFSRYGVQTFYVNK